MDPLMGGLLVGGANLLGSVFGTTQNNQNQQQMQQQAEQYNTQMSNTAYQRATADMRAAGLNPMMMFGSGSAASSPTIQPALRTSALSGAGPAAEAAIGTAVKMRTADATINNLVEQNAKIKAETLTEGVRPLLVGAQAGAADASGRLAAQHEATDRQRMRILMDDALSASNRSSMDPSTRRWLDMLGFGGQSAAKALSPVSNILSSAKSVQGMMPEKPSVTFKERWSGDKYSNETTHHNWRD